MKFPLAAFLAFLASLATSGCRASGIYLVRLKRNDQQPNILRQAKQTVAAMQGVKVLHSYEHLDWMAVEITDDIAVLEKIQQDRDVLEVIPDTRVRTFQVTQPNPDWGLDRLDQTETQGDGKFHYKLSGGGVNMVIVDTGVRDTHEDFGGRASCLYNSIATESCEDLQGHGTFVASLAAGSSYGVAKSANILSVKVLDASGSGSNSGVIAGLDHVLGIALSNPTERYVVNMSLGGDANSAIDDAIRALVEANVVVVVAAGNDSGDACVHSPARASEAITVAASNDQDGAAWFSDLGSCVNVFAPGEDIIGAGRFSDTATTEGDGTSMASPFVAGVAALYVEHDRNLSAPQVGELMLAESIDAISVPSSTTTTRLVNTMALTEAASCDESGLKFELIVRTDGYANETSWTLARGDGVLKAAGFGLENHADYATSLCLTKDCYDFEIHDAYGDGLCSGYGEGGFDINVNDQQLTSGCDFGESTLVQFGTCTDSGSNYMKPDPTEAPTSAPTESCSPFVVSVFTDRFSYETGVHLTNVDTGEEIWHFHDLQDETLHTWEECIDRDSCYSLSITDSWGDGICCSYGEGYFTVTIDGETTEYDGSFGSETTISLGDCTA